jgi:hypothetical protein
MRKLAVIAAALTLGCFAMDEIDQGQKVMDQHYGKARQNQKAAQAAEAPPAEKPGAAEPGMLDRARAWWEAKRAAGGESDTGPGPDPEDVLVRCKLGGGTQFMRKFDCQLRGGKPVELESTATR